MAYKMADSIGGLQREFDAEDQQYADWFKTQASLAQSNRAAAMAAQQEALRQAQLAEAYDFQDLQNQQIQKQRALENAMGGRRQLQHEYEFGERLKSEAANLKAAQEMEKLRIGEQKAREAEKLGQQESKEFLRLLDYSKNPQASYSDFTSAYDEMPYLQGDRWQKLMSNLQETQGEVAALDKARARQAEYWSQMALDASRAPITPEAKQKAVNDFYAPIMKSKGFHENFYIDDDWTVRPLPVRRPTDAIPSEAERLAAREFFERGSFVPPSEPRREQPPAAPIISTSPRTSARPSGPPESAYSFASESEPGVGFSEREAGFPGMLNLVNPGSRYNVLNRIYGDRPTSITYPEGPGLYFGESDPNRISRQQENQTREEDANLGWFRRKQRQDGLKRATDALSSGVPATRLTDAAAGAALAPSMGGGTERNAELGVKQARWLADRAKDFVMQKAREVVAGRIALPPGSAMAAPIFVAAKLIQDGMWDAAEKISEQAAEEQFWQHRLDAGGRTVSGDEMLQLTQQAAAEGRL